MAGMLPGVESARRRRVWQSSSGAAEARRASLCLYAGGRGRDLGLGSPSSAAAAAAAASSKARTLLAISLLVHVLCVWWRPCDVCGCCRCGSARAGRRRRRWRARGRRRLAATPWRPRRGWITSSGANDNLWCSTGALLCLAAAVVFRAAPFPPPLLYVCGS